MSKEIIIFAPRNNFDTKIAITEVRFLGYRKSEHVYY